MATLPQNKKGYIRGVRGFVITKLLESGAPDPGAVPHGVKTAQQVDVDILSIKGDEASLRGGDELLAYAKDKDVITGLKLSVRDARFDAQAWLEIAGGTLIKEVEGADERIVGWRPPTIVEQATTRWFKLEAYARNHTSGGQLDGYIKYTFNYCRGVWGKETLADKQWLVQDFEIECFENPASALPPYEKRFVAALPAELV